MKNFGAAIAILACCNLCAWEKKQNKKEGSSERCSFQRGDQPLPCELCSPSYNYPASPNLCSSCDLSLTASYLYWWAGQDGMDLATDSVFSISSQPMRPPSSQEGAIFQTSDYTSGFKVGIGWQSQSAGNWIIEADYTGLCQHVRMPNETASFSTSDTPAFLMTSWYFQSSSNGQAIAAQQLSSSWRLDLDWLDAMLSRPFYQGSRWIFVPKGGLRVSWIEQSLQISASHIVNVATSSPTVESSNKSRSWGIGPRAFLESRWLGGGGIRLQGAVGTSLLFTQFNRVSHSEDQISLSYPVSYAISDYNCLSPMAEMNLGIGWVKRAFQNRFRFDLSAIYEFNYLWGQNRMRSLNDLNIVGSCGATGDLYLHGLTVTGRFDF